MKSKLEKDKKDHPVGERSGAASGALTGAAIGAAGGPAGVAIGTLVGAIGGIIVGASVAELVNPTEFDDYWAGAYKNTSYYQANRTWEDYAPAYGLGYHAHIAYRDKEFADLAEVLEQTWKKAKGESRLAWNEAREAIRDGWNYVERTRPGGTDK